RRDFLQRQWPSQFCGLPRLSTLHPLGSPSQGLSSRHRVLRPVRRVFLALPSLPEFCLSLLLLALLRLLSPSLLLQSTPPRRLRESRQLPLEPYRLLREQTSMCWTSLKYPP